MSSDYEVFRTFRKDRVFWVVMDNPEKRNAMGLEFWRELPGAFEEASADEETRAVVLAAEGKSFCAGIDLMGLSTELPALMTGEAGGSAKKDFIATIRRFQAVGSAPETCPKPVIAAIHGHCIGGGLDLAAACDIRLAAGDTVFSLREARVAMISDLGSLQRLSTIIGEGFVRELALTTDDVDAQRALSMHLVNGVYDDRDAVWEAAQAMAERIADNSPQAVQATKEVLNWGRGRTVEDGLEFAAQRQTYLVPNPDLFEAIAAYAERRKPEFK